MRVRRRWLVLGALLLVVLGLAVGSREFTYAWYVGDDWLVTFGRGNVCIQYISERRYVEMSWSDAYFPLAPPAEGVSRNARSGLAWRWPELHEQFSSVEGTWWELCLPLWSLVAVVPVGRGVVALRRRLMPVATERSADGGAWAWRWRRRTQLASLFAAVLMLAGWMLSVRWCGGYYDGERAYVVERCALIVREPCGMEVSMVWYGEAGWTWDEYRDWSWELPRTNEMSQSSIGRWAEIVLPFWTLTLLAAAPGVLLLSWPRRRPGTCRRCGYDLTGNVSGVCPECGTKVPPTPAMAASCPDRRGPAVTTSNART